MEEERKLPPLPPLEPPDAPMRRRRKYITLTAVLCTLSLALGIWIGAGIGRPEPTEPGESQQMQSPPETTVPPETTDPPVPAWEANLLRSDAAPSYTKGILYAERAGMAKEHPVFGSKYRREQITSVTFLPTLAGAPIHTWDVSEAGNGRVVAWVVPDGELYDLYIAAEGGVNAANACADLFAGYTNVQQISFGAAFHTTGSADMSCMFLGCEALTDLDPSRFDTSAVRDMSGMFYNCGALTELELHSFDTSNVQDMSYMFCGVNVLRGLNLSSFDTSSVQNMDRMFCRCGLEKLNLTSFDTSGVQNMDHMFWNSTALTELTLGDNFVTTKANTYNMFENCPAGADWRHILN